MIHLDYRDSRPLCQQVRDGFRRLILSGALPAGSRLPSVRELAAELTINPNTIRRAYRKLEDDGCIVSVPGRGSFVSRDGSAAEARRQELLRSFDGLCGELELLGVDRERLIERLKGEAHD